MICSVDMFLKCENFNWIEINSKGKFRKCASVATKLCLVALEINLQRLDVVVIIVVVVVVVVVKAVVVDVMSGVVAVLEVAAKLVPMVSSLNIAVVVVVVPAVLR